MADTKNVAKHLNNLIQLDYDAIAAYDAAIERLENPDFETKLREFRDDHLAHVEKLGELVQAEGSEPASSSDMKKVLTKGQVVMGGLVGDGAILEAMKLNEDQTNSMYEAETAEDMPPEVHQALERGLADERRHRAWIQKTLAEIA